MKHLLLVLVTLSAVSVGATTSKAAHQGSGETRFFNLSAIPNVAIYNSKTRIEGFTLSLWGENEQMSFALGIVNGLPGDSGGFAVGVVNYGGSYTGLLWSAVNWTNNDLLGAGVGVVNYVGGRMSGAQLGAFNYAGTMKGLQFGIVNYATTVESGIQIGLINVISSTKSWFGDFPKTVAPFMIIANWSF